MDSKYTKCDYKIEEELRKQLISLENQFRDHYNERKIEIVRQKELIEKLWVLSQRYLILSRGIPCIKPYPEIISTPVEDDILTEFHLKLNELNDSNGRLSQTLQEVQNSCQTFDDLSLKVDLSIPSPFIQGDTHTKPIFYFIELPEDTKILEEYKKLLSPPAHEDFEEYFLTGMAYCKCLKTDSNIANI